ncbi:murein biosynthesis integral membrane protein MurJ [Marinimicrococcus flavescens]|uniref:Probable lipid II flippase MurJ n=1 Tax=Marinimicrococcus flavescens TaxID=3031815 RepID=A0AAP3UYY4_9PROT|nr:murein biosynthesis integral membrane protein MurJ [Marinimicrococcus flavescens]
MDPTSLTPAGRRHGVAAARGAVGVGGLTMLSRLLGYARDALIAASLGAGWLADAFFVGFKLVNLVRRLAGEGAFGAAFVPLFLRELEAGGPPRARRFAEQALAAAAAALLAFLVAAELLAPALVRLLATGFAPEEARFAAAVGLLRIMLPYLLWAVLAALLGALLGALGRFMAAAAMPILLNLCMIAGLGLAWHLDLASAAVLAWSVALAGLLQFLAMLAAVHAAGYRLRAVRPRASPPVRRLARLGGPALLGTGALQINLLVDSWLASHLAPGAVSWLFYADRLVQLPLGLVGVALGTVLLPLLSRAVREGDAGLAGQAQNRAIEAALLLVLPAAVGLAAVALPLIQVLFERGAFGPEASGATAVALAAFAIGLPAQALARVLAPSFFAREDTRTPLLLALACVAFNAALAWLLMGRLGHAGIALATSLAAWLYALWLGWRLWRAGHLLPDARLRRRLPRLLVASGLMGLALWAAAGALDGAGPGPLLAALVGVGVLVYLAAAQLTGAASWRELAPLLRPGRS